MKINISKLLYGMGLIGSIMVTHAQAKRSLDAHNISASGSTNLSGATVQNITVNGTLTAKQSNFGTITLLGSVDITNCSANTMYVQNEVIEPSDTPVILNASTVSGNVVFEGAYGKVILRNGSSVGGVVNGEIIIE
jgi:hypothetical protein